MFVGLFGFCRGVPAACVTAGLMLDLFFIFFDPCAGRHSLFLLRQKK
jgi:hypothetical protein